MRKAAIACGIAILLAAAFIATLRPADSPPQPPTPEGKPRSNAREPHAAVSNKDLTDPGSDPAAGRRMEADWKALLEWLRSNPRPSPAEIKERLLATRVSWSEVDPQIRAEIIGLLLNTGEDAGTGLPFEVGIHGLLAGWPSLRVFLLDVLATSDPEMAASIARKVLDKTGSPDEYATGLRSLVRRGPARAPDTELLTRFNTLLARPDWQSSRATAESLDMTRLLGSAEAVRSLAAWPGKPALKEAVIDEFASAHPAAMLEAITTDPSVAGANRAQLMARADPADVKQLDTVQAYLKDPSLSPEEASAFLKIFPFRSATTGHRLYAGLPAPYSHDQIRAGDQAALARVNQWLADPSMAKYREDLDGLQERLDSWNKQKNED